VSFACVLANFFGLFRQVPLPWEELWLRAGQCRIWFVYPIPSGAERTRFVLGRRHSSKAYPVDVQLIFPVVGRGRPRVRHVPDPKSRAAHTEGGGGGGESLVSGRASLEWRTQVLSLELPADTPIKALAAATQSASNAPSHS